MTEEESFEAWGLSLPERAHRVCQALERELRKRGVITTAHYEAGIPLLVRAFEAVLDEERERPWGIDMQDAAFHQLLQSMRPDDETLSAEGPPDADERRELTLRPPAPGYCPVCASPHDAGSAHNRDSLYYQLAFYREHQRWPTWKDACAELPEAEQARWRAVLAEHGAPWE